MDNYIIFQKKSGWDGWANLTWRSLNPELTNFLRTHETANYEIEIEKDGKKTKNPVQGKSFSSGGRRYRLEFTGIGELKL